MSVLQIRILTALSTPPHNRQASPSQTTAARVLRCRTTTLARLWTISFVVQLTVSTSWNLVAAVSLATVSSCPRRPASPREHRRISGPTSASYLCRAARPPLSLDRSLHLGLISLWPPHSLARPLPGETTRIRQSTHRRPSSARLVRQSSSREQYVGLSSRANSNSKLMRC